MKTVALAMMMALNGLPDKSNTTSDGIPARQPASFRSLNANTMEKQANQIVSEFLTAVQTGDQATLAASLHTNVTWNQPGTNRFSGIRTSSADVFQMVGGMFELTSNTLALTDVKALTTNGNTVACLVHWKAAQPTGVVLDVDNIDVYTVENGKIVNVVVYSADIAQEDHFWAR